MVMARSVAAPRARSVPASRPTTPRPAPLRLVQEPQPRRRALTRLTTALAVAFSAVGLFLVVFLHVLLAQGQARLDSLTEQAEAAQAENGRLRVSVAELESPSRIVNAAGERLGMVPPATVTYLKAADPAAPLPPVPTGPVVRPSPPTTTAGPPTTNAGSSTKTRTTPATIGPSRSTPTTVRKATTATTVPGARR